MTDLLCARAVSRVFDRGRVHTVALDGINLAIDAGESVAIQGPSGSGKSTLLSLLGLLDVPSQGEIFLRGQRVGDLTRRQQRLLRNRQIGWVFQNFNLIGNLNALENITLPLRYDADATRKTYAERGRVQLERVGLSSKAGSRPNELSGGEQQRVAIARALVNIPQLLLADEPTGNLDSASGSAIMDLLLGLVDSGTTLVVVTHDDAIASRCHRRVRLIDGRIVHAQ